MGPQVPRASPDERGMDRNLYLLATLSLTTACGEPAASHRPAPDSQLEALVESAPMSDYQSSQMVADKARRQSFVRADRAEIQHRIDVRRERGGVAAVPALSCDAVDKFYEESCADSPVGNWRIIDTCMAAPGNDGPRREYEVHGSVDISDARMIITTDYELTTSVVDIPKREVPDGDCSAAQDVAECEDQGDFCRCKQAYQGEPGVVAWASKFDSANIYVSVGGQDMALPYCARQDTMVLSVGGDPKVHIVLERER
jgi:hypothetical protein